jgi:hypothetical protein
MRLVSVVDPPPDLVNWLVSMQVAFGPALRPEKFGDAHARATFRSLTVPHTGPAWIEITVETHDEMQQRRQIDRTALQFVSPSLAITYGREFTCT